MILSFFKVVFYQPLYNGLILLMDVLPFVDAGIAIILFTIIIKLALFPLSKKAVTTQIEMKAIQPKLDALKEEYKDDQKVYAQKMLEMYKEYNINPFSTILVTIIQIPIIISLYYVFLKSGLPDIRMDLIYSFVKVPEAVNMNFIGLFDIAQKDYILAGLAAVTSFFQMKYSIPPVNTDTKPGESFKNDLARSMSIQMRYVFPVIVFFIAYQVSGVVALYWITSNLFTIGQELYVRKHIKR